MSGGKSTMYVKAAASPAPAGAAQAGRNANAGAAQSGRSANAGGGGAKSVVKRSSAGADGGTAEAAPRAPGAGKTRRTASKKRTRARKGSGTKRRWRGRRSRTRPGDGTAGSQPQHPSDQQSVQGGGSPRENYQENAYTAGYELGLHEGGEQLLEQAMPVNLLLPDIGLREVIALGAEQIRHLCHPLMDVNEVFMEMEAAIAEKRPCAVVRLGDGELLTLAQEGVYDAATIQREGGFLPYAGVNPPDLKAREQLAQAVRQAHIVGVPLSRRKHFQPLLHPVLRSLDLAPADLRMTTSAVNYSLHQAGLLNRLLAGKQLLVVGNVAPPLAHALSNRGYHVSGIISPVRGVDDVERVMNEVRGVDFNLALVSAGIAAVILCTRIARELGKTALDFGHMADGIVRGKYGL